MAWGSLLGALDTFTAHPLVRVLLFLAALLGLAIAWLRRRVRRLAYSISGATLVTPMASQYPEVRLMYGGEEVPRVSVSNVVLWNQGNDTVSGTDISASDPIRVEVPEGERVLACRLVALSRPAVAGAVRATGNETRVSAVLFDFLDPSDWLRIQVVHTSASPNSLVLRGTGKGLGPLRRRTPSARPFTLREGLGLSVLWGIMAAGLVALGGRGNLGLWQFLGRLTRTSAGAASLVFLVFMLGRVMVWARWLPPSSSEPE